MWRSPECVYIGLPDERLDASSLGYRNAKKKVSNPLPGVARRERPIAAVGSPRSERQLRAQIALFSHCSEWPVCELHQKIRGQVLKMPSALCLERYLKHTFRLILDWPWNVQWSQVKGYHWREAEIASREPHLG